MKNLVLASSSPRRREILGLFAPKLEIIPSQINEDILSDETPETYVLRLAKEKADDIAKSCKDKFVVGADTTVVCEGNILAKPLDATDAKRMLKQLSGNWHSVLTGVAVINTISNKQAIDICQTQVKFNQLTDQEIDWYIATGEPFDKAGAYAIQGYGSIFIEEIAGNYLNVVGLPITLVRKLLKAVDGDLIEFNKLRDINSY